MLMFDGLQCCCIVELTFQNRGCAFQLMTQGCQRNKAQGLLILVNIVALQTQCVAVQPQMVEDLVWVRGTCAGHFLAKRS
jgi:hypothetical protein